MPFPIKTCLLVAFGLTLSFAFQGVARAGVAVRADFDWSVPDRYGLDSDENGLIDRFEIEGESSVEIDPESWTVHFDACASSGATRYSWRVGDETLETSECAGVEWSFPAEGDYDVALTVFAVDGSSHTVEKTVRVEDWLIVGIGDSYGYGVGTANFPELSTLFDNFEGARSLLEQVTADLEDLLSEHEAAIVELARRREIRDRIVSAANAVVSDAADVDCCFDRCGSGVLERACPCTSCLRRVGDLIDSIGTFNRRVADAGLAFLEITVSISLSSFTSGKISTIDSDARDGRTWVRDWVAAQDTVTGNLGEEVATQDTVVADAREVFEDFRDRLSGNNTNVDGEHPTYSAQARTALALEHANPRTSVTFVHHAVSGSELPGLEGQLEKVKEAIAGREIDSLLVSIGGNDSGFSDIVGSCIRHVDCFEPDAPDDNTLEDAIAAACGLISSVVASCAEVKLEDYPAVNAAARLEEGIATLPGRFADLADLLAVEFPRLGAERVYFTEYPNVTRGDNGAPCAGITAPGVSVAEWLWLEEGVTQRINRVVRESVEAAGWNFVGGIFDLSRNHGYCAAEHWTVRFEEARLAEEAGTNGGFAHPTREAYGAFAELLTAEVLPELTDRLARPLSPEFLRGDCNSDGAVDISDAVVNLDFQFLGDADPGCLDACDANDDGVTDITDAVVTLSVLFLGEGTIPAPGITRCGVDPTEGDPGCETPPASCD